MECLRCGHEIRPFLDGLGIHKRLPCPRPTCRTILQWHEPPAGARPDTRSFGLAECPMDCRDHDLQAPPPIF